MSMNIIDHLCPLWPELTILIATISVLLIGLFTRDNEGYGKYYAYVLAALCVVSAVFLAISPKFGNGAQIFTSALHFTYIGDTARFLLLATGAVIFLCVAPFLDTQSRAGEDNHLSSEINIILSFSLLGMMVMVSAGNFLVLYLGLELQSLALYLLTASQRDNRLSNEAALKYFTLGAIASGVMLFGVSLVYGFTGSIQFSDLAVYLSGANAEHNLAALIGALMIVSGLLFKLAIVPFHVWAPDVYQGAATVVTMFIASAPKVAAVVVLYQLIKGPFAYWFSYWSSLLLALGVASIAVGALGALLQKDFKRLLAYSSINNLGFVVVALAYNSQEAIQAMCFYVVVYITITLGVFAAILSYRDHNGTKVALSDYSGLAKSNPLLAMAMGVLLFSIAGIPPFAGFFAKLQVLQLMIEAHDYIALGITIAASLVAVFYYLNIIRIMYFDDGAQVKQTPAAIQMPIVAGAVSVAHLVFFLFANSFLVKLGEIVANFK